MQRRDFLAHGAYASTALLLGFHWSAARQVNEHAAAVFAPNAWLRITSDNRITVLAEKPELGQGAWTYTAMMVAEELEVDPGALSIEPAPTIPSVYKGLHTGGSGGVAASFDPLRKVAAQAREILINAAAVHWSVPRTECRARNGSILHAPTHRCISYGELVLVAAKLPVPEENDIPLKPAKDFVCIGKPIPRVDLVDKVSGRAHFGIDVRVPSQVHAVIARCPYFGGRLVSFDERAAKAVPGLRAVFPVAPLHRPFNTAGGVAVVADTTWSALQARKALAINWEKNGNENTSTLSHLAEQRAQESASYVAVNRGDAPRVISEAASRLEATYESPFQAHATMEPMNTTIDVRGGAVEVWSPTQFADEIQSEIATLSGLPQNRIIVHTTLSGGSFGRRYQWDYAAEAWQVAKEMSQPVQLLWTREDDLQHDFYRPFNYQRLSAVVDASGRLVAWHARIVTTPIAGSNLYTNEIETPQSLHDPAVVAALEWYGADLLPYSVPNVRIDYSPIDSVVPRSWWRSVSSSYTAFAKECFIDELAAFTHKDPLRFRLELLPTEDPRAERLRAVLQLCAARAGWGTALPMRHGRGIACRFGDTVSAQIAEVAVDDDGTVQVIRVTSAIDCGIAVNPDGVRAMTEGAINFALTAVLCGEITVKDSRVEQSNFHDYHVLRLDQAPEIEVHIIPSTANPSGVGELGAMLVGPAVANAVFAATGSRVRRLPIDRGLLQRPRRKTPPNPPMG